MANPALVRFWHEAEKLRKSFEKEDLLLGFYVIDKTNLVAEIDGDQFLKQLLFDASPLINNKWILDKDKPATTTPNTEKEGIKPPGATHWLPYLPVGGIANMTERTLKTYWSTVMRTVLSDHKNNMGYDTFRYV